MLATVVMLVLMLLLPWLVLRLADRFPALKKLGSVFLCYAAGIVLSFLFKALGAQLTLASDLSSVLVCIAMPLILFSADLPALRRLAKPMLASFGLNIAAVLLLAVGAYFLFRPLVPGAEKISAMLIGTYTGGTPNMFAIGKGLGASSEQILLTQTSDMIGGGIYFLLLISILPRLLRRFLPARQPAGAGRLPGDAAGGETAHPELRRERAALGSYVRVLLLAVLCAAVAMGVCLLLPSRFGNTGLAKLSEYTAVIMLIVTTLGIAFSFVKKVRTSPGSYSAGQYCILMFSVAMGLCFDMSAISGRALLLFAMLLVIQFGTVLLHMLLARLCRIDCHTAIITSTAGVFGPAFIIPVARTLKDDQIILPGILCGILGYAIGNYMGIGVGELLALLG